MTAALAQRIHLPSVASTNSEARRRLDQGEELPELTLIDTDDQTAGRGQVGNKWESEAGQNLSFSLVCHPHWLSAARQFALSQAIALAVCDALSALGLGHRVSVKWPNDIYIDDSKVSGTLIECDLSGKTISNCIVGTGVNVNQTIFRSDAPNPISLRQALGRTFDREALLSDIVSRFSAFYQQLRSEGHQALHTLYMSRLYRRTGLHLYADAEGTFKASLHAVEPTGHLLLRTDDGTLRRYEFKEVKYLFQ